MESVLIVGSGQAGIALASEIRKLDPRRPITLLGRDTHSFNRTEFVQALGPQQTPLTIKPLTDLAERARIESGAAQLRVTHPNQPVTMDYNPQRLNIDIDDDDIIIRLSCG